MLPAAFTASATSATGKITPVSLFAHMMLTSAGPWLSASPSSTRFIWPTASTVSSISRRPASLRYRHGPRTAGCSTRVVMTFRGRPAPSTPPRIAVLSLSVPQLVKMISDGSALMSAATCSRAFSICRFTPPPNACMLDGLPHNSLKKGIIASTTSGATCVVALLSR